MATSEIIHFVLPASATSQFAKLRAYVRDGGVPDQYFGYLAPPASAALPIKQNEMCWVIQWPHGSTLRASESFQARLRDISGSDGARSLSFQVRDDQVSGLNKALTAPLCEFAVINLLPKAPQSDTEFQRSMHRTYTDCYRGEGFVGGEWAYATNTNDTDGVSIDLESPELPETERRLACYYLGWESVSSHQAFSATDIFAEEMVKLMPWLGPGTGAWYANLEKI